jgi:PAS domain S-box-containing protein
MVSTQEYKLLLQTIDKVTSIVFDASSIEELLKTVVNEIIASLELEDCVIYLFDEELQTLFQHAALGTKSKPVFNIQNRSRLKLGDGIVGHVAKYKKAVIINDTSKDKRYLSENIERYSELAVPILYNNRLIGVIDSEHSEKSFYKDVHFTLFKTIAGLLGSGIVHLEERTKLSNSEKRFRQIVDGSLLALMDVDISATYDALMRLKKKHEDIYGYLDAHPKEVLQLFLLMEFQSANRAAIEFFKASSSEHLIKNIFSLFSKDTEVAFKLFLKAILEGDLVYEKVFSIKTFKNELLYLQFVTRIPEQREGFRRVIFTYKDITDEVFAKEALLQQKKTYELLLDNVPLDLAIMDTQFRFTYISQRSIQDAKLREWMIGKTDFDYCEYRNLPKTIANERFLKLSEALKTKEIVTWDETLQKKDGSVFYIIRSILPVLSADGAVQNLVGYGIDITERKAAEISLELREERLRILLASIGEAVIATDSDENITEMNAAAEHLLNQKLEHLKGTPLSKSFSLIEKDTAKAIVLPITDILKTGKHEAILNDLILVNSRGQEFSILYNVAPITSGGTMPDGAVIVLSDITEKVRLDAELEKSQRLESIGILAGGIAHDFNNLLTGIIGNIDIALDKGYEFSEEMREHLSLTKRETLKATTLSNQLLTFSKGGDPSKKTIQIESLIRDTIKFTLRGSSVHTYIRLGELPNVDVDSGQLTQVIQNLTLNAMQAMNGTGQFSVRGKVTSITKHSYLSEGDYVQLFFKDTGVGLSALDQQKIFDPYYTTKIDGNGLGLATSFSVLHRHHGYIEVESELGEGATFIVYLPVSKNALTETVLPEEKETHKKVVHSVIVLDDEVVILDIITAILDSMEIKAVQCLTGEDVLKAVKENPSLDCFILDLTIRGGLGGYETLMKLRETNPKLKAIVSSGYSNDPIMANFKEHGFDNALAKPFTIKEFKNAINSTFGI